jgi:hypothetical protein
VHLSTSTLPQLAFANYPQVPSPAKHPSTRVPTSIGCLVFKEQLETHPLAAPLRTANGLFRGIAIMQCSNTSVNPLLQKDFNIPKNFA